MAQRWEVSAPVSVPGSSVPAGSSSSQEWDKPWEDLSGAAWGWLPIPCHRPLHCTALEIVAFPEADDKGTAQSEAVIEPLELDAMDLAGVRFLVFDSMEGVFGTMEGQSCFTSRASHPIESKESEHQCLCLYIT